MYDLVSNLAARGEEVTVLAINTPKHYQPGGVLPEGVRLLTVPVNTNISILKAFAHLFRSGPYNFARFRSRAYAGQLAALLQAETFDLVQVEGSQMAWCLDLVRRHSQAPVVLRAHNVEYSLWFRLSRHDPNPLKRLYFRHLARRIRRLEKACFPRFDLVVAVTPQDQGRIQALAPGARVRVVPAGVETGRLEVFPGLKPKPKTLFVIGSLNWQPNLEGLTWFLEKVWPEVQVAHPELELHVAGSFQPDFWQRLPRQQVIWHGFVPEAAFFMQQFELMLVPLLSGGGMRVKIVEGLSLGKCILTTPVGAEGVAGSSGEHLLLAEEPGEWIRLLCGYAKGDWTPDAFREKARSLADRFYDNKILVNQYLQEYRNIISAKKSGREGFLS